MTGLLFCKIKFIIIAATFLKGSTYRWLGPIILCGIAILYSIPCVLDKFFYSKPYNVGNYHSRNKKLVEQDNRIRKEKFGIVIEDGKINKCVYFRGPK